MKRYLHCPIIFIMILTCSVGNTVLAQASRSYNLNQKKEVNAGINNSDRIMTVWDLTAGYSGTNNPNGVWSYGRKWSATDKGFDIFTTKWGSNGWYMGNVSTGGPSIQAGPNLWARDNGNGLPVMRWTCPANDYYNIKGFFIGSDNRGVDVIVYITLNDSIIFSGAVKAYNAKSEFDLQYIKINQNSKLDYIVKLNGGDIGYSWTSVNGTIETSASKSITLTSPNGGETYTAGTSQNVKWSSANISNVKIEYTTDNGANWKNIIASTAAATGNYTWQVPNISSKNCKIRVGDTSDVNINDVSDSYFTISGFDLTSGMVAYYPFNGNANDESGNGNNGTVNGATLSNDRFGNANKSYNLSGNSQYLSIPNKSMLNPSEVSVSAWVKVNGFTSSKLGVVKDMQFIIFKQNSRTTEFEGIDLQLNEANKSFFAMTSSADGAKRSSANTPDNSVILNKWYFLTLTQNSTEIKIYLDGVLQETKSTGFPLNYGSNPLYIGRSGYNSYESFFNGVVDDIRIYNRILSLGEIQQLFIENGWPSIVPTVSLTSPRGGENWLAGSAQNITWTSSGVTNVKLEYSIDNGSSWQNIVASTPANTGSYTWTVPNTPSSNCLVKISDVSSAAVNSISSSVFTIKAITVSDGLIAYFPFNGNASDESGNNFIGKIFGAAPAYDRFGVLGKAYGFDGNDDYIEVNHNSKLDLTDNFTFSAWINPKTWGGNNYGRIIEKADASNGYYFYMTNSSNSSNDVESFKFGLYNGGQTEEVFAGPNKLVLNQPVFLTVTCNNKVVKLYKNGTLLSTVTLTKSIGLNTSNLRIGNGRSLDRGFAGSLDEVRIYNRGLSQTEINTLYNENNYSSAFLKLTSPNGGENLLSGLYHLITWAGNGFSNVKIEYSTNNGSSWNSVTASTPANLGSYKWIVPTGSYSNCKLRVSDAANSSLNDVSDSVFTISGSLNVALSANGGAATAISEGYYTERQYASYANDGNKDKFWASQWDMPAWLQITFNKVYNVSVVGFWWGSHRHTFSVSLSADGTNWKTVIANQSSLNLEGAAASYEQYPIEPTLAKYIKVNILATSAPSSHIFQSLINEVEAYTSSTPQVTLTSPNGGENWQTATSKNITWSSNSIANVKLEYTTNNGTNWSTIITSTTASTGSYSWTVPNTPSTLCRVRISDVSSSATSDLSDNVFTISQAPVKSLTLTSPNGGETWLSGTLKNILWQSSNVANIKLEYSSNNGTAWNTLSASFSASGGSYTWTVPNIYSTNCLVRISDASNSSVFSTSSSVFTINNYPTSITLSKAIGFSGIDNSNFYKIIGLPGQTNFHISTIVKGTQKTEWNAYWDNGAISDFQKECDGSGSFNFTPGNAFWVISKNTVTVSRTVNTVALASDQTYTIPLHSGWNLISNPFEINISWSDVKTKNGIIQPLWSFDGSYAQATAFIPYNGYYFYNDSEINGIKIPYKVLLSKEVPVKPNGFKLVLNEDGKELDAVAFSYNENGSDKLDKLDIYSPGDMFAEASINILHPEANARENLLKEDVRPSVGKGQQYILRVKNQNQKKLGLCIDQKNITEPVFLVDDEMKKIEELKNTGSLLSNGRNKTYRLIVGNQEYINELKNSFLPKEFCLYQNYPNPFNPVTVIRFALPQKEEVTICVFNVLGQMVNTLVKNQTFDAGTHELEFKAGSLTSGIYFTKIFSRSDSKCIKMTLSK